MMPGRKRSLSQTALLRDLFRGFLRGPAAIVARDTFAQSMREVVDLKRKRGLGLSVKDLARVQTALHGIEGSRRYVRGYEFIYAHLRARLSPATAAGHDQDAIFPPSRELIDLAGSFELGRLRHTVAFLEKATRQESAPVSGGDLRAQWDVALAADGAGAYEHFTRSAWLLISLVARMPRNSLFGAIASIPHAEPYLRATQSPALNYYEVLAEAPKFLRIMVYFCDANRPGHALQGASIPFPPATSEYSDRALDSYLETVLGESAAKGHVFYSTNRERIEEEDPIDVQSAFERACLGGPRPAPAD